MKMGSFSLRGGKYKCNIRHKQDESESGPISKWQKVKVEVYQPEWRGGLWSSLFAQFFLWGDGKCKSNIWQPKWKSKCTYIISKQNKNESGRVSLSQNEGWPLIIFVCSALSRRGAGHHKYLFISQPFSMPSQGNKKNRTVIRWILFDYHKYVYLYRASTISSVTTSCSVLKSCTKAKNNSYHFLHPVFGFGEIHIYNCISTRLYLYFYFLQIVFVLCPWTHKYNSLLTSCGNKEEKITTIYH